MKTQKLLALMIISSLMLFSSCSNDEPGPKGDKGEPGTTNVMYSSWFEYTNSNSTGNFSVFSMEISVPQLTQEFINNGGSVLMYTGYNYDGEPENIGQIKSLPTWGKEGYLNVSNADDVYYDIEYRYEAGRININFIITKGHAEVISTEYFFSEIWNGTGNYFRYVLIPGGSLINGRVASSVDFNNYNAVKALYSIPD